MHGYRFTDVEPVSTRLPHTFGYLAGPLLSLSDALRSLERQIKHLHESIGTAKSNCYFPSEHGLTRDESAAIYIYTMESTANSLYQVLNRALRSKDRNEVKPWFPYLKLFHTAVQKLPDVCMNLWRGVKRDFSEAYKKDGIVTWWGISSCSPAVDVITDFLGDRSTLFLIEAATGKDISKYSMFPEEKEVILGPATRLRVVSNALEKSSLHVVHLKEISNQNRSSRAAPAPVKSTAIVTTIRILTDEIGNRYDIVI